VRCRRPPRTPVQRTRHCLDAFTGTRRSRRVEQSRQGSTRRFHNRYSGADRVHRVGADLAEPGQPRGDLLRRG
jgi:hypothetical protein